MTIKEQVIDYLQTEPKFRERSNKDRGQVNLLLRKYTGLAEAVEKKLISKDSLIAFVQDYASMDRAWRQALERDVSLRGTDYGQKEELMAKKQEELGYTVAPRTP